MSDVSSALKTWMENLLFNRSKLISAFDDLLRFIDALKPPTSNMQSNNERKIRKLMNDNGKCHEGTIQV